MSDRPTPARMGRHTVRPADVVSALSGVAFLAFLAIHWLAARLTPNPPALPAPPVTMFVLDGAGDHHGRWVELPADTECACGSSEHITLTGRRCGHTATLHHCHHGARP